MDLLISDNGFEHSLLILSGWGFDHNIFKKVELPFNIMMPIGHLDLPFDIEKIENSLPESFFVMGWSLGAVVAVELARLYPNRIKGMFFCCLRTDFSEEEIAHEKILMQSKGVENYLTKFYKRCFSGQMEDYQWFRDAVEPSCLETANLEQLLAGLDYLRQHPITTLKHLQLPVKLFYGNRDIICPPHKAPQEVIESHKKHILKCGHLPFLRTEFSNLAIFD